MLSPWGTAWPTPSSCRWCTAAGPGCFCTPPPRRWATPSQRLSSPGGRSPAGSERTQAQSPGSEYEGALKSALRYFKRNATFLVCSKHHFSNLSPQTLELAPSGGEGGSTGCNHISAVFVYFLYLPPLSLFILPLTPSPSHIRIDRASECRTWKCPFGAAPPRAGGSRGSPREETEPGTDAKP